MIKIVTLLLVAYLLGSIPSGVWIGKLLSKKDIRQFGSRNTGATNTLRALGKPIGITVLLMDILKGTLTTSLSYLFGLQGVNPLFFGVAAVLRHIFPIFANFKGGKAVATSAGILSAYSPTFFIYSVLIFVIYLYLISMASSTSMISAVLITLPIIVLSFAVPAVLPASNWLLTVITITPITLIFIRHRESIQQVKNGIESRLSFDLHAKKIKKKAVNK